MKGMRGGPLSCDVNGSSPTVREGSDLGEIAEAYLTVGLTAPRTNSKKLSKCR
jgi:hypothetical protein